jgi:hypothetical protein
LLRKITGLFGALVVTLLVVTARLSAAPEVLVSAQGDCPSQHELEAALIGRGLTIGDSNYLVSTHVDSASVEMTLLHNGTDVVVTRRFSSPDCRAVSDAVAVVVEAYFVEVIGLTPEVDRKGSNKRSTSPSGAEFDNSALQVQNTNSNIRQMTREATLGAVPSNPGNLSDHDPRSPGDLLDSKPDAPATSSAPMRRIGFVGIGPVLPLPRGRLTTQFEVGGGVEFPTLPLSIELQLATLWPSTSGGEPNRVRRWSSHGLTRAGVPLGDLVQYRPWLGVGLTLVELRALDIAAAPSRSTLTTVVGAGLEIAWPLAKGWLGRLDLSCMILTTRDSYRIEPDGEIGRGPRVVCSSMMGIGFGSRPARFAPESRD